MESGLTKEHYDERRRQVLRQVRARIESAMQSGNKLNKPSAVKAGVGETYLRDLLQPDRAEKEIQLGKLVSIAQVLGVSIGYLVGETEAPEPAAGELQLPDADVAVTLIRGALAGLNRTVPLDVQASALWDAFVFGLQNVQASPQLRQQPDLLASISQTAAARHQ